MQSSHIEEKLLVAFYPSVIVSVLHQCGTLENKPLQMVVNTAQESSDFPLLCLKDISSSVSQEVKENN